MRRIVHRLGRIGGAACLAVVLASQAAGASCIGAAPLAGGGVPVQGTYVTPFQDANKSGPWPHDTDPVTGDSNLCWAATAANMLAYGGWGVGVVENDAQAIFVDQMNPRYNNVPGFTETAIADYFDTYHPTLNYMDYYDVAGATQGSPSLLDSLLAEGRSLGLYLSFTTESGAHALSVWGTVKDPASGLYTDLLLADNEDNAIQLVPTPVRETNHGAYSTWSLPTYWGAPTIGFVDILESATPGVTLNQVWTDDIPPISDALAAYLRDYYALYPEDTGVTDAPITGFNGSPLTAADTGHDGLRYTPGPNVADQTPGNGIDELVPFSFSLPQIAGRSIASAELTLSLTPRSPALATDVLFFADNASRPSDLFGNDILKDLALDVPATVTLPLNAMPSGGGLVDLRPLLADGTLDVIFGDDALIHWVALTVTMFTELPEPATITLFALAIVGLAAARRRAGPLPTQGLAAGSLPG
ncbi:PEP-CTERM sorting domain-containing protein [Elioraea rosea]|uniref:PEP-CTERM sorting domain-containing protein n=1 Tax=Elioraea rosea TaxID=2492390 RepID=UPI001182F2AB|nr:PEP-CTERM sorting domain-containing protein [Elioraea rosea]